ncbi:MULTISPECIES: DUF2501 domain-containing protein [Cedecea]|uniref:DUF2501 domain-containing protein n=1 Tax=Cedecea davisae DSM 4568 TaxID=566551 RepID=S3J7S5_9ENTR|nr:MULTISPECIES: DUF2501 domain-containing protein [Cedecea]EPF20681.1 hypothetical protein HMPREF0201_00413 [Cedecea davisae DSM 4568]QIX95244.1 DUF2501 domain-containing protein [Cedecea sp. FDAARGOS_727]SUX36531.1 Protein of uncharacterised function (DUF2501) [Cedecea davisae]
MKVSIKTLCAMALATAFFAGQASAASWQDQLSSAANELSKSGSTTTGAGAQNGGLSLSSLTSLLNGNGKSLTSSTMTNAAGVMEYCAKNKLASVTNTENIKNQLMTKLGLENSTKPADKQDYNQGLMGLLNTANGQKLDLNTIGNSPLAEKVKTKACDLVLKQGMNYLS